MLKYIATPNPMTIFALSTPPGIGGIATIRISGPQAIAAAQALFLPANRAHSLETRPSHTLTFGQIIDPANREPFDEVVLSLYRAPHSFTGEDVVEISCHGSQYIQQRILEILSNLGREQTDCQIRLAEPGEFTRRAFANGRIDLSQAEAVADLIASQSAATHRLAMNQMKGSFSRKLDALHDQLLQLNSLLELELDFSEEEVEFADRTRLLDLARDIDHEVTRLADTFQTGQAIKDGIPVAIIGETNAGKSTLLNKLLHDDRALVSDVHGTTRDVIEDTAMLGGQLIRFIDTAGIRDTHDKVEYMGIERTYQRLSRAQIVLWMIDGTRLGDPHQSQQLCDDVIALYRRILPYLNEQQRLLIILNKVDLVSRALLTHHLPLLQGALNTVLDGMEHQPSHRYLTLSAKHEEGLDQLREALLDATQLPTVQPGDVVLTNLRHYQAMQGAHLALQQVIDGLLSHRPTDLIAEDLRAVITHLNSILGREITSQETLNNIFSHFCIGK